MDFKRPLFCRHALGGNKWFTEQVAHWQRCLGFFYHHKETFDPETSIINVPRPVLSPAALFLIQTKKSLSHPSISQSSNTNKFSSINQCMKRWLWISYIYSQISLSTYFVMGIILDAGDAPVNKEVNKVYNLMNAFQKIINAIKTMKQAPRMSAEQCDGQRRKSCWTWTTGKSPVWKEFRRLCEAVAEPFLFKERVQYNWKFPLRW